MKITYIKLLIILFITSMGCKDSASNNKDVFAKGIETLYTRQHLAKLTGVIIIPGEGCGNCINDASLYCLAHQEVQQQYGIIFTGVKDKKTLKIQFKEPFFLNPNVVIDTDNYFMKDSISSIYPQIVLLENSEIKSVDLFSSEKVILK